MHMRAVVPPVMSSLIQQLAEPSVILLGMHFWYQYTRPVLCTGWSDCNLARRTTGHPSTVTDKSPNVARVDVQLL